MFVYWIDWIEFYGIEYILSWYLFVVVIVVEFVRFVFVLGIEDFMD